MISKSKRVIGLNVQFPISQLITSGKKTVETRTYPIPAKLVGKEVAIVETPGPKGKFKARIVCLAVFGESFPYKSQAQFYRDQARHKVSPESQWAWNPEKPKCGWPVKVTTVFSKPITVRGKRGIRYTNDLRVP